MVAWSICSVGVEVRRQEDYMRKRQYVKSNGSPLSLGRIIEFLLYVRDLLKQGVRKPVAIEVASNRIETTDRIGKKIWDNRYIFLKKGRR